jgi:hypothetical protein
MVDLVKGKGIGQQTGSKVEIGDYIATERTSLDSGNVLLLADGSIPDPILYPLLTAELSATDKITKFSEGSTNSQGRNWTMNSTGTKGWYGWASNGGIYEVDLVAGTTTLVFTATSGNGGCVSACCSDDGQNIYMLNINTSTDDFYCVFSNDSGGTWSEIVIGATILTAISAIATTTQQSRGNIECNPLGTNIKCILVATDNFDFTLVFESTDSATSFNEILTPRKSLSNPGSNVYDTFISRDLTTVGIFSEFGGTEKWLSVGGGAFTDVQANYPITGGVARLRTTISADGNAAFAFKIGDDNFPRVYFSTDNMVSWTGIDLIIPKFELTSIANTLSVQFHPTDNDLVYMLIESGVNTAPLIIYSLRLSTEEIIVVGNFNPKSGTGVNGGVYQLQSLIRLNGSDILYGQADGYSKEFAGVATISNGKFIADASTEALTYKIVADAP